MFQYAAALAQAQRLGVELKIDASRNRIDMAQPFNLSLFNLPEKVDFIPSGQEAMSVPFIQRGLGYDDEINNVVDGDVLVGYFQSERYFKDIEYEIRQRLTPGVNRIAWSREALEFLGLIVAARGASTMIGIRRGDYLQKAHYHGLMPDEYYSEGLRVIREHTPGDPVLFVFTDDPFWVEQNLAFPYETHVFKGADFTRPGHIGREDIDLAMMMYCHNAIISNSSFHWWGAWLGDRRIANVDRTVVAPATWFTDNAAQSQAGDIVPERWIKI